MGHTASMARETGDTHDNVRYNIGRIRTQRRLSLRELAALMRPGPGALSHSSIGEIERGVRRCDVDELTALATTLDVSPVTLLMPYSESPTEEVSVTGMTHVIDASFVLGWLRGDSPVEPERASDEHEAESFRRRSLPSWAW